MSYELSENEGKTRVRFTYGDIDEKSGSFFQTGTGEAFGYETYRS